MADQARATSTAPPREAQWEHSYPGLLETARCVRRDVRAALGPCPEEVADDVELVVSELAANATRHSRSGMPGETYIVRVSHYATEPVPYVWVEVEDGGSPSWDGVLRPQPTHGLEVIKHLCTAMGSDNGQAGRRVVYARLEYQADGTPIPGMASIPDLPPSLTGIRD